MLSLGDVNGDNALDVIQSDGTLNAIFLSLGNTQSALRMPDFSLAAQSSARTTLETMTGVQSDIALELANIGAYQSRLSVAISTNFAARENYLAANSRIRDADVAQEAADLLRLNILQQASAAVLGQANQQPALALQLLGGF